MDNEGDKKPDSLDSISAEEAEAAADTPEPVAPAAPREKKPKRERPPITRKFLIWSIGPIVVFLALTVAILTTGTPSAAELMKQATSSFGEVGRGSFTFQITITPKGGTDTDPSTISLTGPFELVKGKPLPVAKINYVTTAGGRSQTVTLQTTGDKAYTIVKGQAYELPASATKDLVTATKQLSAGDSSKTPGLSGLKLNFAKWLINPKVGSGEEIDGTPTWRTSSNVDVIAALKDLTGGAQTLGTITGSKVGQLSSADIAQVKKGIKNASVEVFVGRYDRIVRKLDLTMDFVTPASATAAAGGVTGGRLDVLIGISKPNQPVNLAPPKNPLPYKALQSLADSTAQAGTTLDDGVGQ